MSRLARSTLIVAVFFGLEKLLGFARQALVARTFGLSPELDAFNAANNLPDLIFALISGGALAVAFIPVLSQYLEERGRPAAWDLFSRIANLVFLVTAGLSILVALFADQLVGWRLGIAPGFSTGQQELVASLMRLNLVATLLFSLGGLVIAGLQANQHFLLPAIAPSMYDIGTLFGVLILAPEQGYQIGPITLPAFGFGVYGLVYGVILGAALFVLVQVPGLFRYQFHWSPRINLRHPGVRQVLSLLGPRLVTVFFIQLTFIAQDNIASRLADRFGVSPGLRLVVHAGARDDHRHCPGHGVLAHALGADCAWRGGCISQLAQPCVARDPRPHHSDRRADRCWHHTGGAHPGLRRRGHCHGGLDGAALICWA